MMELDFQVVGGDFSTAGLASGQVKKVLKQLNVPPAAIRRTVVALYEAEVNIVAHAFRGDIHVEISPELITMDLKDEGPGIADISLAMTEGFSTASQEVREMGFGAGMGLPNIKKNVDSLKINSEVNKGTHLIMEVKLN